MQILTLPSIVAELVLVGVTDKFYSMYCFVDSINNT